MLVVTLVAERVDGTGSITHPLHSGTFDEALAVKARFDDVGLTTRHAWRWSIAVD